MIPPLTFDVPVRIRSEMNLRVSPLARARHFKRHRRDVALAFRAAAGPPPHRFAFPLTVVLTRLGPTFITDDDNIPPGLKAVRDEVARCLGVNDGDQARVRFIYAPQEKSRHYGVRVTIAAQ